jgi:hypothetical protein
MAKEYRIHIRGKQREDIDVDLMAQLVVMLGRQLAQEAKEAAEPEGEAQPDEAQPDGDEREPDHQAGAA